MSEIILHIVPETKAAFLSCIKRLGTLPDAYKACTSQPYLTPLSAWKKAVEYIEKEGLEREVADIIENFEQQQLLEPLSKEQVAMELSKMIVRPDIKPVDSIKAIAELIKLQSWEVKKSENKTVTAKADLQNMIKELATG